jgi:hypothetical protein
MSLWCAGAAKKRLPPWPASASAIACRHVLDRWDNPVVSLIHRKLVRRGLPPILTVH